MLTVCSWLQERTHVANPPPPNLLRHYDANIPQPVKLMPNHRLSMARQLTAALRVLALCHGLDKNA